MAYRSGGHRHPNHHFGYLIEALTLPLALLIVVIAAAVWSLVVHWS